MGLEMDGAMQQAPQPGRQTVMACRFSIINEDPE
jgi:hypothetical protein